MEESIIYVDINATEGENDGSSWGNAYTDLQSALAVAGASDRIWVAAGTYLPTNGNNLPEDVEDPREVNFVINNGVKVYGGFIGGETSLAQRDIGANPTILSGNIGEDTQADNSYHVVDITGSTNSTVIDGFTITEGQADGDDFDIGNNDGGGLFGEEDANVTIRNSTVENNFSSDTGGGIFAGNNSSINLVNSTFRNNVSASGGGGIYLVEGTLPNITNSSFYGNESQQGGAVFFANNETFQSPPDFPVVTNSTFVNNIADEGNSIYLTTQGGFSGNNRDDNALFQNSILWDTNGRRNPQFVEFARGEIATINNSIIQGGYEGPGEGNLNEDPLFNNPANNDFRLRLNSPGIDAGNNEALASIAETTDVRGNPRIYNETVDIGAIEYGLYLDINDVTVTEGNQGTTDTTFTVNLLDTLGQPATQQISVNYGTADSSANAGTDFTPTSGTLVFSPGDTERTITVPVSADTQPENDETFLVNLANPTGNAVIRDDRGVGLIVDDDVSREGDTVFRLLNLEVGVHFYTTDAAERDEFIASGNYESEGASFTSVDSSAEGAEEVYRFFNATTGVHLYTTEEVERDSIQANLSEFAFEGEVFNAYATEVEGSIPVYRFFNPSLGVHFYTPNEVERDFVEANLPNYESEGIAYYAFPLEE